MTSGGGRMSHRRHRLVRGRPSRVKGLIDTARILNKEHQDSIVQAERRKEPMFDSVKEAFEKSRSARAAKR